MDESQTIGALIDEGREISKIGGRIQQEIPSHFSDEELADFRARYKRWYDQALPFVHPDMKSGFEAMYEGASQSAGIKAFLRHATTPSSSASADATPSPIDRFLYWKYLSSTYFDGKIITQLVLLNDAYHRSQISSLSLSLERLNLHPRVHVAAGQLFEDGHRRMAVFQACVALNEAVQEKSGRTDLDGTKLMQHVFKPNEPVLKMDGHPDEQQGYMFLFSGAIMAIRNPRAHRSQDDEAIDVNESLELLSLISVLFRALDRASLVPAPS